MRCQYAHSDYIWCYQLNDVVQIFDYIFSFILPTGLVFDRIVPNFMGVIHNMIHAMDRDHSTNEVQVCVKFVVTTLFSVQPIRDSINCLGTLACVPPALALAER